MADKQKKSTFLIIWSIFWIVLIILAILCLLAMSLMGDKLH